MNKIYIPENYKPVLDAYDTQRAIAYIKETFQQEFSKALNLKRVSAPLFVTESSGLNDNLNGYERPVAFDIPAVGMDAQVVHSLAKWKRLALKRYNFTVGNGLYTDMNAIRRDEALDNIHSIYVDQWDWEKIITRENRNLDFLKLIVRAIVGAICDTNDRLHVRFPQLRTELRREVTFITAQELEDMYPDLETGSQRENAFVREHKTACVMQIGGLLRSGKPHDGRAPDYDDWSLNGDILMYNPVLDRALPQNASERRAASDHRRRHRPEPSVHADDGLRPHRRSTVQRMGQRNCGRLRKGRNPAAVIYILTKDAADTTASFSYKQISKIG